MCTSFLIKDILSENPEIQNDYSKIVQPNEPLPQDRDTLQDVDEEPATQCEISDVMLLQSNLTEFKEMCKGLAQDKVKRLKKRRRTLKNRKYQELSRIRKTMEIKKLYEEVAELRQRISMQQESSVSGNAIVISCS